MPYLTLKRGNESYCINQEQYEKIYKRWEDYLAKRQDSIINLPLMDIKASNIESLSLEPRRQKLGKTYSWKELKEFEEEIEQYRIDSINREGKPFRYFSIGGESKYLEDKGILKVDWKNKLWTEVVLDSDIVFSVKDPFAYTEFEHKLSDGARA